MRVLPAASPAQMHPVEVATQILCRHGLLYLLPESTEEHNARCSPASTGPASVYVDVHRVLRALNKPVQLSTDAPEGVLENRLVTVRKPNSESITLQISWADNGNCAVCGDRLDAYSMRCFDALCHQHCIIECPGCNETICPRWATRFAEQQCCYTPPKPKPLPLKWQDDSKPKKSPAKKKVDFEYTGWKLKSETGLMTYYEEGIPMQSRSIHDV